MEPISEEKMQVNKPLYDAAIAMVKRHNVTDMIQIEGYPGMFVAVAPQAKVQAIAFFTENGVRYVVGPCVESVEEVEE
jgi:hypothetical protein